MSLEAKIETLTASIDRLIAVLSDGTPVAVATPVKTQGRKPRVEQEPQATTDDGPPMEPVKDEPKTDASSEPADDKSETIDYKVVADAINTRCAQGMNKAVKAVLLQFGANNGKELKAEQYGAFLATLSADVPMEG